MGLFTRNTDDTSTPRAQTYSAQRTLTAAASRVNIGDKSQIEQITRRRSASQWQDDAWEYYDIIGEVKYAFRLFANVLAKVRIHAAYIEDDDELPVPLKETDLDDDVKKIVRRAMRRPFGPTNQADLLRKAAINLLVVGECYLVQLPPKFGVRDTEQWKILSIHELQTRNGKTYYKRGKNDRTGDQEELPKSTFIGRIWIEHARYADDADSSMRAAVNDCDDLLLYTRAARSSARSRLNAGALFVPDTLSVSVDQPTDDPSDLDVDPTTVPEAVNPEDDLFEQELIDAMTTPISDESSAASVVPLLIRGPAEAGKQIVHIKFDRPFDPQIAQRAERSLERILQSIDLPKDIVTGLANIKYSNGVQIQESLYSSHIEPLILLLCDAFRIVYLVPALERAGIDPDVIENVVIWYDPSAIQTAPDKSNAANTGFDKYALSFSAWRRANGFDETDAPDGDEIAQRIAIARGQLNDQLTEAVLRTIIPDILDASRQRAMQDLPTGAYPPDLQSALGDTPGAPTPPPAAPPAAAGPTAAPGELPPIVDGGGQGGATPPPPVPGS